MELIYVLTKSLFWPYMCIVNLIKANVLYQFVESISGICWNLTSSLGVIDHHHLPLHLG